MNRLNKTESAFSYFMVLSISERFFFQDYLEVAIAVVVLQGVGKTSSRTVI